MPLAPDTITISLITICCCKAFLLPPRLVPSAKSTPNFAIETFSLSLQRIALHNENLKRKQPLYAMLYYGFTQYYLTSDKFDVN